MKKGDIIKGRKTVHPIVFLKKENEDDFIGCIITHSNNTQYPNNIGLTSEHFLDSDEKGHKYEVEYDNSFFVKLSLIKKYDWGPFEKKGQLTGSGIKHIEKYLKDNQQKLWRDYIGN